MLKPTINPKSQNNINVNDYVIYQLKRKLSPIFIRSQIKLKAEYEQLCNESKKKQLKGKQNIINQRNSEMLFSSISSKMSMRNKMRSYVENIARQTNQDCQQINLNQFEQILKYYKIQKRVEHYLNQQKQNKNFETVASQNGKIRASSHQKLCTNEQHPRHYKRIITSLIKPFNFSNIYQQIKNNQIRQSLQNQKVNLDKLMALTERGTNDDNNKVSRRHSKFYNKEQKNAIKTHRTSKLNPKNKLNTRKLKRKRSILIQQPDEAEDEVDLQFEQGLVQQIYNAQRIKFRKKINNVKSRKNIYDGQLYFLKQ